MLRMMTCGLLLGSSSISSTALAQFTWKTWTYVGNTTAITNFTNGSASLNVSGFNNFAVQAVDDPVQYQPNFPFTQSFGDSVGAVNNGTSSFQVELGFSGNTTGLVLGIGQFAHVAGFSRLRNDRH